MHVPLIRKSLYLLSDNSLIQSDQGSNCGSDQDALVASIDGRVDAGHVFEVDEAAEGDVLREDDIHQQGLDDVEGQRVEGVVEMRRVAASRLRLAGQVDEVGREQGDEESRETPKQRWTPERSRQQQEEIGNLDSIVRRLQGRYRGNCEREAIGQQLWAQKVELEQDDEALDGNDGREAFTRSMGALDEARFLEGIRDPRAQDLGSAVDRLGDDSRGRWQRHPRRERQVGERGCARGTGQS